MKSILVSDYLLKFISSENKALKGQIIQYLMSSNSPSGGTKEIVQSFSNFARRTH